MNAYLEITLLPSNDIGHNFLWEKLYKQIHIGLVDRQLPNGLSAIGVSFPEYDAEKNTLGTKLRLFAQDKKTLEHLDIKKWLRYLLSYVHIADVRDVPGNITNYIRFKRKQSKSSTERLARRKANRENITLEQAIQLLNSRKDRLITAPFIKIKSSSSEHDFRLFIVKEKVSEQIYDGFSCYGLSATATIPDF